MKLLLLVKMLRTNSTKKVASIPNKNLLVVFFFLIEFQFLSTQLFLSYFQVLSSSLQNFIKKKK